MIVWRDAQLGDWQAATQEFARGRLGMARPGADAHAAPDFPVLMREMRELGLAALCAEEGAGGLGQDEAALAAVLEPLCAADASAGAAVYATGAAHLALRQWAGAANPLPPVLDGKWLAWPAFHDIAEQEWPALDAEGRLRGRVEMLLIGAHADHAVVPARSGAGDLVLVLVDLRTDAVRRGPPVRTLGLSACGIIDADFIAAAVLWRGEALRAGQARLQERLAVPALAMLCGLMAGSVETASRYTAERYQGGGPIKDWGEVRRLLALQRQHLQVAAGLLQQQAEMQTGREGEAGRQSLLHVANLACKLASDGVQLLGGNGYMKDYGQEKRLRDACQLQSLGGSVAWRRQQLSGVA